MRLQVHAAVSDLHAADEKYNRDCLQTFKCTLGRAEEKQTIVMMLS